MSKKYSAVFIPGDGIGTEVMDSARRVIDASGVSIDWIEKHAGISALERYGEVLPLDTLEAIKKTKLAIKGPTATPSGGGHTSVNVQIRKKLDLYAAVRPVRTIKGINTRYNDVEIVIIRENTEGLYSGIEHEIVPGIIETIRIITEKACMRIAEYAFDYASTHDRKKVSFFHKANIIKMADGLFLDCVRKVRKKYPKIEYSEYIIDNGCMQLVTNPKNFDVLLLENFYGDLISDLCAGLVGGLGVVPGANLGRDCSVFEAVHGSAPDIAGKGVANPLAMIMSGVMMLHHIGEIEAGDRIKAAYNAVLSDGIKEELTRDIGGTGTTNSFTEAVISRL